MNMKKLFLGALLAVSATTAFGVQNEAGMVTTENKKANGAAELQLESYGSVRAVTQGTLYLVFEAESNNQNDKDKVTFNFDTINTGTVAKQEAKVSARLFVGSTGGDTTTENLLPVQFQSLAQGTKLPEAITFALVDDNGVEHEFDGVDASKATMNMPVYSRENDIIGALEYGIKAASLADSNKQVLATLRADLYTKGSTLPESLAAYRDNGATAITDSTGDFTVTSGKVKIAIADLDLSHDANVNKVVNALAK